MIGPNMSQRKPNGRLITGFPGDYSIFPDLNLNGSRGAGWHYNVMLDHDFDTGWRFTKWGALFAAWWRAR